MAWIYLAASAVSQSHSKNGLGPSPTVSKILTHKGSYLVEWLTDIYHELRFGMTLEHLMQSHYLSQLTSSTADSPAKIFRVQDLEKAWAASEVGFSSRLSGLQKKLERRLCFSKTCQQLELEDFEKSSEHLPIFGMTVDGRVYLPQKLEPHTLEKDGFYLPTITASDYGTGANGVRRGKVARKNLWPTPMARDWKDSPNQKDRGERDDTKLSIQVYRRDNGGHLNPMWVEWLMGYPLEWTALSAWVTPWFRPKSKKRLKN